MEIKLKIGNDIGNSEQDIIINGDLIRQPSVYAKVLDSKKYQDESIEAVMKNIYDKILITVDSPSCNSGTYLIGDAALDSGLNTHNILVGFEDKHQHDLPIINTLAIVSAYSTDKYFKEHNDFPTELNINAVMTTGLPIYEYYSNLENKKILQERFEKDVHRVTLHIGPKRVRFNITFEFVKVLPEAMTALFSVVEDENGKKRTPDFFKEFNEMYNKTIDGNYFKGKRTLHIDIGDGTTEMPVLDGFEPNPSLSTGYKIGVGYALEEGLEKFKEKRNLISFSRQDFSKVIKNKNHRFHDLAIECVQEPLYNLALEIKKYALKQLEATNYDIDILIVYGGGSILLKPYLYEELLKLTDQQKIELLFIDEKEAVTLNAFGLYNFVNSKLFDAIRKAETKTS